MNVSNVETCTVSSQWQFIVLGFTGVRFFCTKVYGSVYKEVYNALFVVSPLPGYTML